MNKALLLKREKARLNGAKTYTLEELDRLVLDKTVKGSLPPNNN